MVGKRLNPSVMVISANILQAMKRNGTAYGYKWWFVDRIDNKRPVYGINKDGDRTKVFESVSCWYACISVKRIGARGFVPQSNGAVIGVVIVGIML